MNDSHTIVDGNPLRYFKYEIVENMTRLPSFQYLKWMLDECQFRAEIRVDASRK